MRRLALAALALFLLRADMYPDASNAKLPQARANLGAGNPVSITDHGARADAITLPDGIMAAGSATLTSAKANFTQADVGKQIQVDGAASLLAGPLATTIAAVTGAHTVTLAAPATAATPRYYYASATVATPRTAGNYIPGDVLTLQGGTSTTAGQATVSSTYVTAATIVAGGAGGTAGGCVVQGTTGAGTLFRQNVTIAGGAITALGTFVSNGTYFTKPTNLVAEPVTNAPGYACAPGGATLNLTMGVGIAYVSTKGNYSVAPSNPVATSAGSISGATGATLNVSFNSSGAFVYGTDDSQALKEAIAAAAAQFAAGKPSYVFMPAGNYLIDQVATPIMGTGLGIVGEGLQKTNIVIGANYVGDLFSWSEAWLADIWPINGTMPTGAMRSVPKIGGFSIVGNRTAAAQQNAIVFYDRIDGVIMDEVNVAYINGRCLYSGVMKNQVQAYMRESKIGRFGCSVAGNPGIPAIEFSGEGNGDGTDEINITEMDIYAPYGHGLVLRSNNAANSFRNFRINKLRIEGLQWGSAPADLLRIGDPVMAGPIANIYFNQLELLSPYPGQAALRVTSPNVGAANPYFIRVESGLIAGGLPQGYGVVLEGGRNMQFNFSDIYTWNTNFTMTGFASLTVLDGNGAEKNWTYNLASPMNLSTPLRKQGYPNPTATGALQPAVVPVLPDGTTLGGNQRGGGAVDWQAARNASSQVASGLQSVIAGGGLNTATGQWGAVSGGFLNSATGFATAIPGGGRATDRGSAGGMFYSPVGCATFGVVGGCQRAWHVLGNTTTTATAVRLTSDAGAAVGVNCIVIPAGSAYQTVVRASLHNRTNHAVSASWDAIQGLLHRGTGSAAYLGGAGGAPTYSTAAAGTLAVTADAANNCLNVTYTPAGGNTDLLDIVATVDTTEVQ